MNRWRAVHWLRSRQEERELAYWLTFVAYDRRDRSVTNRLYLLYLVIFFTGWIFITLTLFASGGALLLRGVDPEDTARAAVYVQALLLVVWGAYALWRALRRSPVVFNPTDAALMCQTPAPRRAVALRWLPMPWFKSGVLFWLAAVTLGFSYAETVLPEFTGADRIIEYAGYGLAAWAAVIPVHLALVALVWVVGVYRLQEDREQRWLVWPVLALMAGLIGMVFLSRGTGTVWDWLYAGLIYPLRGGFGIGSLPASLVVGGLIAVVMFGLLLVVSGNFSLSRAAQETQHVETAQAMRRYGLSTQADKVQTERRLGVSRAPSRLPDLRGAGALVWKDVLQSLRAFRWTGLFEWAAIFGLTFGLALLPDVNSRAFAVGFWAITVGRVCSARLRSDLGYWALVRQLPVPHGRFMLAELGAAYLLAVMISLSGLTAGSTLVGSPVYGLGWLIPGMAAGIAGVAAFDVVRRSDSTLLLNGSAPEVGVGGIIMGLLFAFAPLAVLVFFPGSFGVLLALLVSVGLGWLAFNLAVRAYSRVDAV